MNQSCDNTLISAPCIEKRCSHDTNSVILHLSTRTTGRITAIVGRISTDLLLRASSFNSCAFISFPFSTSTESLMIAVTEVDRWALQPDRRRKGGWLSFDALWKSCSYCKHAANCCMRNLPWQAARRLRALIYRSGWPDSLRLDMRNGQSSERVVRGCKVCLWVME